MKQAGPWMKTTLVTAFILVALNQGTEGYPSSRSDTLDRSMSHYGYIPERQERNIIQLMNPQRGFASPLRSRPQPMELLEEDEPEFLLAPQALTMKRSHAQDNEMVMDRDPIYNPFTKHMKRERHLKELYEKIAQEFPIVAKQGLSQNGKVSLNDLFAMTIFGQPRRSG